MKLAESKEVGTLVSSEETPNYSRISGTDIAGNPVDTIQDLVEAFRQYDISPHMLKEFKTFEQTLVAVMIIKFHLMISKQQDYGPGNILKAGQRGIATRTQDKLERLMNLIGDPESQVRTARAYIEGLENEELTASQLDGALTTVYKILNPSTDAANESIDDTWLDMGNYGDIGYTHFHGAFGKPLEENL